MDGNDNNRRDEIFSKVIRAGKRTYFFDVKATRGNDYYLTVTESKKRFNDDGKFFFEKHKLFLYKEDFEKFANGLKDVIDYIQREQPYNPEERHTASYSNNQPTESVSSVEEVKEETPVEAETSTSENFSDISFDDLGDDASKTVD